MISFGQDYTTNEISEGVELLQHELGYDHFGAVAINQGDVTFESNEPTRNDLETKILEGVKIKAKEIVYQKAEVRRGFVLGSTTPTQMLVWGRKAVEARDYLEALQRGETPNESDFVLLQSSIGVHGATMLEIAQLVIAKDQAWRAAAAAIDNTRYQAFASIDAATSPTEVKTALQGISFN